MADSPAPPTFAQLYTASATAGAIAEAVTIPLDGAKVRLQLQKRAVAGDGAVARYRGPIHTIGRMVSEEGIASVYQGLSPGVQRQLLFSGIRLGVFDHLQTLPALAPAEGASLGLLPKMAIAATGTVVGILVANPADVLKVRWQASGVPAAGMPRKTSFAAYRAIIREEGPLRGLYRGLVANLLRNTIISTAEIVTYDQAKIAASAHLGLRDAPLHLTAGATAGFVATVLGSPMDVVGTVMMAQAQRAGERSKGLAATVADVAREHGVRGFYRGFIPNFARIGSFNVLMWATYEQVKRVLFD